MMHGPFAENMTVLIKMWCFLEGNSPPPAKNKQSDKTNKKSEAGQGLLPFTRNKVRTPSCLSQQTIRPWLVFVPKQNASKSSIVTGSPSPHPQQLYQGAKCFATSVKKLPKQTKLLPITICLWRAAFLLSSSTFVWANQIETGKI